MKNVILFLIALSCTIPVWAETLGDVEVLEIKTTEDGEELKLKDLKKTPNGYFFVVLESKDKESLAKSSLVIKKLLLKDKFKLTLEIHSFSSAPAGSFYKSSYVEFKGN